MFLWANRVTIIVLKLNFFLQLIEKHPWRGSGGEGSSGFSSFLWWLGAEARMEQEMLHGMLCADAPVTCTVTWWLFPTLYPFPSSLPCVQGHGGKEKCWFSLDSQGNGGELSSASAGHIKGRGCPSWRTHLWFLGSNVWPLTAPREDKNYLGSSLTHKGVGKVLWHHNIKGRKNMEDW